MHKIIDDNKSDLFLNPIPKWITFYGFWTVIILFIGMLFTTKTIKSPKVIKLDITLKKSQAFLTTDFTTFKELKSEQVVNISIPTFDKDIQCKLKKENAIIENNTIIIPLILKDSLIKLIKFNKQVNCQGSVIVYNKTIFEKILN